MLLIYFDKNAVLLGPRKQKTRPHLCIVWRTCPLLTTNVVLKELKGRRILKF